MSTKRTACLFALLLAAATAVSARYVPGKSAPASDQNGNVVFSAKPLQGRLAGGVEEKLRIGENALGEGTLIVIDQYALSPIDGNIYLLDARDFALHIFDPSGRHVRDFRITKGQGPGEMSGLYPLFVRAYPRREGIWAEDSFELALFDHQGKILHKKAKDPSSSYFQILGISPDTYLAVRQERDPKFKPDSIRAIPKTQHLQLENWEGRILARYFSSDKTGGWGNVWLSSFADYRLSPLIVSDFDSQSRRLVYASSDEYTLTVKDPEGKALQILRREFQPQKITPKIREALLTSSRFQQQIKIMEQNGQDFLKMLDANQTWEALNPIIKIQFLANGWIGVFVLKDVEGRFETDIFDRQGRWRITLQFPDPAQKLSNPTLWGSRLAGLETGEDGELTYVEYSLKNVPPEFVSLK